MDFKLSKRVVYTDNDGLKWVMEVLEETPKEDWGNTGILLGPPDLTSLGLTKKKRIELQNELVSHNWIQAPDLRGRKRELIQLIKKMNLPNSLVRHVLSIYQYAYYDAKD